MGHRHSHLGVPDRSREGVRAVAKALGLLGLTAVVQAVIYFATGSVALLADLIHNGGDALTALPIGAAFLLRSHRLEHWAGPAVVLAIFVSACVALYEAIMRLIEPQPLSHLGALAAAGFVGFLGNEAAAWVRLRAGRRLESPALVADGYHARTDGLVSLGVVLSALFVWAGLDAADPAIALVITAIHPPHHVAVVADRPLSSSPTLPSCRRISATATSIGSPSR